jgi:hypothetical protein
VVWLCVADGVAVILLEILPGIPKTRCKICAYFRWPLWYGKLLHLYQELKPALLFLVSIMDMICGKSKGQYTSGLNPS